MNERHLRETIQKQSDKIKELEADWLDEYTKCQLIGKEIEKLNKILYYFDTKLKNNAEYQQLKSDLIGGQEEQINFECLAVDSDCTIQCNECKINFKI
jgi:hypothetical protein